MRSTIWSRTRRGKRTTLTPNWSIRGVFHTSVTHCQTGLRITAQTARPSMPGQAVPSRCQSAWPALLLAQSPIPLAALWCRRVGTAVRPAFCSTRNLAPSLAGTGASMRAQRSWRSTIRPKARPTKAWPSMRHRSSSTRRIRQEPSPDLRHELQAGRPLHR